MAGTTVGITKAESLAYDHRLNADANDPLSWLLAWFYQMGLLPSHFKPPSVNFGSKVKDTFLEYHSQVGLFRVVLGNKQKIRSIKDCLPIISFTWRANVLCFSWRHAPSIGCNDGKTRRWRCRWLTSGRRGLERDGYHGFLHQEQYRNCCRDHDHSGNASLGQIKLWIQVTYWYTLINELKRTLLQHSYPDLQQSEKLISLQGIAISFNCCDNRNTLKNVLCVFNFRLLISRWIKWTLKNHLCHGPSNVMPGLNKS